MLIFRATSLKYCCLHVLNFYLDNGVVTTPKRRILSFVFTVLSFKKSLLIRIPTKISSNGKRKKAPFNSFEINSGTGLLRSIVFVV